MDYSDVPSAARKNAMLRRLTLLPVATVLLTSVALAVRSTTGSQWNADLAALDKPPKCDPSQPTIDFGTPQFWIRLGISAGLVLLGGLFAGLTLAYMTMDMLNLQVLQRSDVEQERMYAAKIAPIRKHEHWLLITLLLANVIVNESLPILLDDILGGGFLAIFISTALVVCFGEIIPNAICNRWGLPIAAYFAPFVRVVMFIMFPIAYPASKLLDWALEGEKGATVYRRGELKALIGLHEDGHGGGELSADEVNIIRATLDLSHKSVSQVMTPLEDVYMLSMDRILDREVVREIRRKGHSRIPVYEGVRSNVRAMFLVKNLIDYDPHDCLPVRQFPLMFLPLVSGQTNLFDALNLFQEGRSHMALVTENLPETVASRRISNSPYPTPRQSKLGTDDGLRSPLLADAMRSPFLSRSSGDLDNMSQADEDLTSHVIGIVTLEDVLEELIGEEIIDETDEYIDVHTRQRVTRKPWKSLKSIQAVVGPYLVKTNRRRNYGAMGSPALSSVGVRSATPDLNRYNRRGLTAPDALAPKNPSFVGESDALLIPPAESRGISFVNGKVPPASSSPVPSIQSDYVSDAPEAAPAPHSVRTLLEAGAKNNNTSLHPGLPSVILSSSPRAAEIQALHLPLAPQTYEDRIRNQPSPRRRHSQDEVLSSSYRDRRANGLAPEREEVATDDGDSPDMPAR